LRHSRNTLGLIRNSGVEPHLIEYLKTPPSRALLAQLIERASLTAARSCGRKERPMPTSALAIQN
jgi:arsenate reductase